MGSSLKKSRPLGGGVHEQIPPPLPCGPLGKLLGTVQLWRWKVYASIGLTCPGGDDRKEGLTNVVTIHHPTRGKSDQRDNRRSVRRPGVHTRVTMPCLRRPQSHGGEWRTNSPPATSPSNISNTQNPSSW